MSAPQEHDESFSDRVRKELMAQGIALEDVAGGTSWRRV